MEVENVREAWPQNVDGNLLEHVVQHINSVHSLHLLFALFVGLNHDQAWVEIVQLPIAILFQFVDKVLADDLAEDLVEHVGLLGFVADFEVKKLKNEKELFGYGIWN